jgi:hypothetical protein
MRFFVQRRVQSGRSRRNEESAQALRQVYVEVPRASDEDALKMTGSGTLELERELDFEVADAAIVVGE